jgi:hypothetical protein
MVAKSFERLVVGKPNFNACFYEKISKFLKSFPKPMIPEIKIFSGKWLSS